MQQRAADGRMTQTEEAAGAVPGFLMGASGGIILNGDHTGLPGKFNDHRRPGYRITVTSDLC